MALINKSEIKELIAFHEKQINILHQLLDISLVIDKGKPLSGKLVAEVAKGKKAAPARKAKTGRKKRGAVSSAIVSTIAAAKEALTSGDIKTHLESIGLARKGSSAVYATLLQMSNRKILKKVKSDKGIKYSLGAGATRPVKKKRAKKKTRDKSGAKRAKSS